MMYTLDQKLISSCKYKILRISVYQIGAVAVVHSVSYNYRLKTCKTPGKYGLFHEVDKLMSTLDV